MATLRAPVTSTDHIRGWQRAPVTLIEYGDYECPYCAAAHPIVNRVRQHFGKKLRFVFRHFPLTAMHPHAEGAAESAEFAGVNGAFWGMHDCLCENQNRMDSALFLALAEGLGLSAIALQHALVTRTFSPKVRDDFLGGVRSGVNGTPCFFVNDKHHDGSLTKEDLVEAIEAQLHANVSL
jgi:protein-disulfide isomerase